MRPVERIPNFINKVNWGYLEERWDVKIPNSIRYKLNEGGSIRKYWMKCPDLRFGQMLIKLCILPDTLQIWQDEEYDILKGQGLAEREIMFWGRTTDENRKPLPQIQWILIKDMSTDHIKAILADVADNRMNPRSDYIRVFKWELELRESNQNG